MTTEASIQAIFITPRRGAPMQAVERIDGLAGRGLRGDRYGCNTGTMSHKTPSTGHLTLIEAEALEAAARDHNVVLPPHLTRRNVLTRSVALNHLVDREFQMGSIIARGIELCEPCGHMERLAEVKGARKALVHRGGLRCEILRSGEIAIGDAISAVPACV